jgi:DNA-binding response OmpR family regulator
MNREVILVVDDNEDIRIFVRKSLEEEGYEVVEAEDGNSALASFNKNKPILVVLDLAMGQPDGFEVCREIRKKSAVPIIMLTNRSEELDEAMCLAAGADDYITKPVSSRILGLRVGTQIRHRSMQKTEQKSILIAGILSLNLETRELMVDNRQISLTRTEFDFVRLLIEQPKRVFTREQVIEAIGGSVDFSSDHLLDTHASRIRIKVKNAGGPKIIDAVRGVGYRLMSDLDLEAGLLHG